MKNVIGISLLLLVSACSESMSGVYTCFEPDGKFGSRLDFRSGGKVFLDLVPDDLVKRVPSLADKQDVAGEYEIVDEKVILKYLDGYQVHTLIKDGNSLSSNTNSFHLCAKK